MAKAQLGCAGTDCPWGWAAWGFKDQGQGWPAPTWPLGGHGHTLESVCGCHYAFGHMVVMGRGGLLHTRVWSVCLFSRVREGVLLCVCLWVFTCVQDHPGSCMMVFV